MRRTLSVIVATTTLWLTGCDQLGIESAADVAARREADGRAVGAGCRHAARSVEDCYANNKRADKAAVFAGWKEMNDYMRENNMASAPAAPETTVAAAPDEANDKAPAADADKPDVKSKAGAKSGAKAVKPADKP